MVHDPVATRYAQALFDSAKAHDQVEQTLEQLTRLGELLDGHPDLPRLMDYPGISAEDKVGVLKRALKGSCSALLGAFVHMVVSLGRAELLREMVEAFQAAVDVDQRRLRVVVRSARPLSDAVLNRLRKRLETLEDKTIELTTELARELLGGLQIHLGSRVIDSSVRRQLDDMRQQLKTVRVY